MGKKKWKCIIKNIGNPSYFKICFLRNFGPIVESLKSRAQYNNPVMKTRTKNRCQGSACTPSTQVKHRVIHLTQDTLNLEILSK